MMVIQSLIDQENPGLLIPRHSRLLYVLGQLRLGGLEWQLYYLLAHMDHALGSQPKRQVLLRY